MMKWNQNTSMLKFDLIFSRYHMLHKHFNHFCMILQNNNSFAIVSLYAINRNIYKRYAGVQWIWCMVVFIIIVPRCVVVCKTHISNAQTTQGNKCGYVLYMLRRKDLPPQGIRNNQKRERYSREINMLSSNANIFQMNWKYWIHFILNIIGNQNLWESAIRLSREVIWFFTIPYNFSL